MDSGRKIEINQEHLLCPICVQIPKGDIFQCKNGHHLCYECGLKLNKCPNCRERYGWDKFRNRNRAMESLLDAIKFECQYKDLGCSSKLSRQGLGDHEKSCRFRKPKRNCKIA